MKIIILWILLNKEAVSSLLIAENQLLIPYYIDYLNNSLVIINDIFHNLNNTLSNDTRIIPPGKNTEEITDIILYTDKKCWNYQRTREH